MNPSVKEIDRSLFPWAPKYFDAGEGRMHYIDEGNGAVVLLVHGTPAWSFLFRDLIARLSRTHRVVAVDHLGFGLSDKPADAAYRPEDHARRLEALIEHLGLRDITLVVHDFGGPIGLSFAIAHPDRIARLVLFNTWLWSAADDPSTVRISRILGGPIGSFLYRRFNFSPRVLLKLGFADRAKLTPAVHRHYLDVFPTPADRTAPWVLARELIGSSDWYEALWSKRDRLRGKPMLMVWGMKDPAFGPKVFDRWRAAFPEAETVALPEVGHFVTEEATEAVGEAVERFVEGAQRPAPSAVQPLGFPPSLR